MAENCLKWLDFAGDGNFTATIFESDKDIIIKNLKNIGTNVISPPEVLKTGASTTQHPIFT